MIRLVALDVDGVLTDGRITYGEIFEEAYSGARHASGVRLVSFWSRDGHGLSMLKAAGIKTAWLSGNRSLAVARRAASLGIDYVRLELAMDGKKPALEGILREAGIAASETAFMGDDVPDVPCLLMVGLGAAPADAAMEARAAAKWVSRLPGGQGAVRELCDLVLNISEENLQGLVT